VAKATFGTGIVPYFHCPLKTDEHKIAKITLMKQRVIALMSGGVDSSVAAALLKQQGYDVIGVYILGWTGTDEFPCAWQEEERSAREVADILGIEFYTVNLGREYEHEVINKFFAGYKAGLTPNPDVLCNREIKFKAAWKAVRQFEPDFIATGHYARLRREFSSNNSHFSINDAMNQFPNTKKIENLPNKNLLKIRKLKIENFYPQIFKPADKEKDQTYFLWAIDRTMLSRILFPLGELTKPEVRQLARNFGLPTAEKKDSQGICFVGPLKVRQFLQTRIRPLPGDVITTDGRTIARHDGVEFYTIGQRLGAGQVEWTGDVPPLFVVAKDLKANVIVVGADSDTFARSFTATQLNWFTPFTPSKVEGSKVEGLNDPFDSLSLAQGWPEGQFEASVKIRYGQEDVKAKIQCAKSSATVTFTQPVRAVTPGQSLVMYDGSGVLIGGGIISDVPQQSKILGQALRSKQIR